MIMIIIIGSKMECDTMNDLSTIMIIVILGLCVFYIATDGIRKSLTGSDAVDEIKQTPTNENNDTQQTPTKKKIDYTNSPGRKQQITEEKPAEETPIVDFVEPEFKSIARQDPTKNEYVDTGETVLKQGNDYNPTNQIAAPTIKRTTTTTVTEYVNEDKTETNTAKPDTEQSTNTDDEVSVVCMYCGKALTIKKGTSVTCPSCGGSVEDYDDDLGDLF